MACLTLNCLATCLIFLILMFHPGCLHMQLGEKSVSKTNLISKVFHHQNLGEEYKWKEVFTQNSCSLVSLCFFFSKGLAAFNFIAGKQLSQRDFTYTNAFCEIIIQLTLQSLKTLRLHGLWRLNSLYLKQDKILLWEFSVCLFFLYISFICLGMRQGE